MCIILRGGGGGGVWFGGVDEMRTVLSGVVLANDETTKQNHSHLLRRVLVVFYRLVREEVLRCRFPMLGIAACISL